MRYNVIVTYITFNSFSFIDWNQGEHDWITGKCDHIDENGEDLSPTDSDGSIIP